MLAGTQQSVELKLALDQEQHKSKKLEESMRKLDEEMKRTDELLYQMIPKQVADRLRSGENPINTCEVRNRCRSRITRYFPNLRTKLIGNIRYNQHFYILFFRCFIRCPYYSLI